MPDCALESIQAGNAGLKRGMQFFFKVDVPGVRLVKIFHLVEIILDGAIKVGLEKSAGLLE